MNKIEQIKAEIERQKEYSKDMVQKMRDTYGLYWIGRADLCDKLLAFIESLPEEKPSEDVLEAAKKIYETPFGTRAEDFEAGADWQKEQMMKED